MRYKIINLKGCSVVGALKYEDVRSGDILDFGGGNIGIMVGFSPVLAVGHINGFHVLGDNETWQTFEGGHFLEAYNKAVELSKNIE